MPGRVIRVAGPADPVQRTGRARAGGCITGRTDPTSAEPDAVPPPRPHRLASEIGLGSPPERSSLLACCLTCAFASCLERAVPLRRLPHVVAGCRAAVLRPWRAAGAGLAGFRCAGQAGQGRVDVPEPPADPGRGQPPGRGGPFPGQAQVRRQRPGEAELGVAGDDEPGPPVAAAGSRSFGAVQPRTCLNSRNVCSRSNRRRNACHSRSTSAGGAPVTEHHSHTGLGSRGHRAGGPPGDGSRCPRSPAAAHHRSSQAERWVSRGCSRSQACAAAVP